MNVASTLTDTGSDPLRDRHHHPRLTVKRLELYSALILALGGTLTAWAAFQASRWSGLQAISFSRAAAARTQATEASTRAEQQLSLDSALFTDWVEAVNAEREKAPPSTHSDIYRPDRSKHSGFMFARFRREFRPAVEAWLATRPFTNPSAPTTPFEMPEYQLENRKKAERLGAVAEQEVTAGLENNVRSDRYVFTTVILSSALFFAGVSMKIDAKSTRVFMIAVAGVILLGALGLLLSLPKII